jgi:23S rRNA pseudouridine1911/1915/1917 synthase
MSPRHRFTVPDGLAGTRLDRCLAALEESWSRSRVRRLIDDGRVMLGDRPAKPSATVAAGDVIEVDEPEVAAPDVEAEAIPLSVVYEDDEILLHHCRDLSGIGGVARPGIVHRLDKDTTGLMVVAKTDRAHQALALDFRWRKVDKTYLAVCYGEPADDEGVVDAAIDRHPRQRQQMAVVADGRPARTLYRVVERWHGASLLHCRLVTGRTHQIRVHMAHVGHALVGDPLYAGRQWRNLRDPRAQAACRDFPRQALHAMRLALAHPVTGEALSFEAAVPADLEGLIDVLRHARG